ncbi:Violaxanthin de-epoxidase, chloroplastic [Linum grandiflorum]
MIYTSHVNTHDTPQFTVHKLEIQNVVNTLMRSQKLCSFENSVAAPMAKEACTVVLHLRPFSSPFILSRRLAAVSIQPPCYHSSLLSLPSPLSFRQRPTRVSEIPAILERETSTAAEQPGPPVKIVSIVGRGSISPLKSATWEEVMLHTATRLKWVDEGYEMLVFNDNLEEFESESDENAKMLEKELNGADILLVVAVTNEGSVDWIQKKSKHVQNMICFDSSSKLANKLGGSYIKDEGKESKEVVETVAEAWTRRNTDDIRFCLLVVINAYIRPVSILKNLRSKGFSTLSCMVKNCGPQILDCLLDPNCRKALQCLNRCSPVDQVCNYRCIASYESPKLEAFSLCVLQKHNCLELDAKIPEQPRVQPMVKFQGRDLSHEIAEDLFVGWLGKLEWSWRVVAGQNPAYDQFPCQYQLFYRGKAKGSFWYEPVFQVKTFEGEMVWRRRKYRVKRGKAPGTFYFSVLDNGVVSNEFWTVIDVPDDLSWGLFHYSGAARAAGQSYTGAVLVSPDGEFPSAKERERVASALESCGIKEWELFAVDNCSCQDPPLGIPDGSTLHVAVDIRDKKLTSM